MSASTSLTLLAYLQKSVRVSNDLLLGDNHPCCKSMFHNVPSNVK